MGAVCTAVGTGAWQTSSAGRLGMFHPTANR
jgi:hypothetical protein